MCSAGAFSTTGICKAMQVNSCCSHTESCLKNTHLQQNLGAGGLLSSQASCWHVDGKCLVLAGKFLIAAEELKNQPVTVSATWDATHPTLSQSSIRGFQPHSPWFRAPGAHRTSDPTKSSLHQAPHFWVCTNTCTRTRGGMLGWAAPPLARAQPPEGNDTSLRHWGGNKSWLGPQQTLALWKTIGDLMTLVVTLATRQECSSCTCLPHTVAGTSFKGLNQWHKCKIKARAGCTPRIHPADVSAGPVGVSYQGRAAETALQVLKGLGMSCMA